MFVQPGGLSFGVRGFLPFGAPSSAIFFGGMVVERRGGDATVGEFSGKMGICDTF
jgi:hypothetical protein